MTEIPEYRRLPGQTIGLMAYLATGPTVDVDWDIDRHADLSRDIDRLTLVTCNIADVARTGVAEVNPFER